MPLSQLDALAPALGCRRQQLATRFDHPVILWAGRSSSRNFPQNFYPFRASSHFLYFGGLPLENAALRLEAGRLELFMEESTPEEALWHGATPKRAELAAAIGADADYPLSALQQHTAGAATIPVQNPVVRQQQAELLGRPLPAADQLQGLDRALAQAIIHLRLTHDAAALAELRQAAQVTVAAHRTGMAATATARTEAEVRAAMEGVILAHNLTCAYESIVTVHGEVLHNNRYHHPLQPGDLLLADVGAETARGWAADVTRTWPISGRFSPSQRALYEVVLAAHDACIAKAAPGVEYRQLHLLAAQVIAAGLVDLGILRGQPADLVEQDVHALFFPHGVGHLLGLDVHDMEDLGDLAGYAPGRSRSDRFGLEFLRLDRPLQAGMLVTIEPGFYQVPAILSDPKRRDRFQPWVNWERLADFADVRGIRIEDDVLITEAGCEVLTVALPTAVEAVEAACQETE